MFSILRQKGRLNFSKRDGQGKNVFRLKYATHGAFLHGIRIKGDRKNWDRLGGATSQSSGGENWLGFRVGVRKQSRQAVEMGLGEVMGPRDEANLRGLRGSLGSDIE